MRQRFDKYLARINADLAAAPTGKPPKAQLQNDTLHLWAYGPIGGYWDGVDPLAFNQAIQEHNGSQLIVHVNSDGGDVFGGIAMHNAIATAEMETIVVNEGLAASAASLIMQAGELRIMENASRLMIHKAWSIALGNADDMRATAAILDGIDEDMISLYEEKSTLDTAKIEQLLAVETWMSASEAVADGFADQIGTEQAEPAARVPYERLRARVKLTALGT